VFESAGDRVAIGTDEGAQLCLGDRAVSRFHAEIEIVDGRALVKDLGSRNGLVVDQVPVIQAPLRDGAVLTLGRTQLRFSLGAATTTDEIDFVAGVLPRLTARLRTLGRAPAAVR